MNELIFDRYLGDYSYDATPLDADQDDDVDVDDLYERLDSIDEKVNDLQIMTVKNNNRVFEAVPEASPDTPDYTSQFASLTDAVGEVNNNLTNMYTWIMVIAFIIVLFEVKKMFRGAIKTFDKD